MAFLNTIVPKVRPPTATWAVTIYGNGFTGSPTVTLQKFGQTNIAATGVTIVNQGILTCNLPLTGAALGPWDVVVVNNSVTEKFVNGFLVGAIRQSGGVREAGSARRMSAEGMASEMERLGV